MGIFDDVLRRQSSDLEIEFVVVLTVQSISMSLGTSVGVPLINDVHLEGGDVNFNYSTQLFPP